MLEGTNIAARGSDRKGLVMKPYMTTREVAKILGVTPRQVQRYIQGGRLRGAPRIQNMRSRLLVDRKDVERLVNEMEAEMDSVIIRRRRDVT